jgi:MFS family permease
MSNSFAAEKLAGARRAALLREAEADRLVRQVNPTTNNRGGVAGLFGSQLTYLFLSSFVILFVGMGLFPVLPVYAAQFGATRTVIGVYFALMYAANAAGSMLTNRLAGWLTHRGLFVAAGAAGIPALLLVGQATALWQVMVLTSIVWFCGGMLLALINVFTGLYAGDGSRGKSFSLMFLAFPLGAIFGGTTVSRLVAETSYYTLFVVLAVVWAALPVMGVLRFKSRHDGMARRKAKASADAPLGAVFFRLLIIAVVSAFAINIGRLGMALSMQALNFAASDIAGTATVSGLLAMPAVMVIGALSDRLGRQKFLMVSFAAAAGGSITLALATQLWMFWLAATLTLVALCTNGALLAALIADRLPASAVERGLPWIHGMSPVAGTAGFLGIGYAMDTWGQGAVYTVAATMAVLAAVLLWSLGQKHRAQSYRPSGRQTVAASIGKTA